MVSVFPNAVNTVFNGDSQFVAGNVVNNQHSWNPKPANGAQGLDHLREYCALDALVDANQRFDPPRCAEATREQIIQEILDWIDNDKGTASMVWLYGSAGAGKSAILQTVAEKLKKQCRLLASFFFSRTSTSSDRSDGNRLIPTLVYQLSQAFPETKAPILSRLKKDPAILSRTRDVQMSDLFMDPLQRFSFRRFVRNLTDRRPSRLIVIDGLDECQDPHIQCDLLKITAWAASSLRLPLRFLIASRPEPHIRRTVDHDERFPLVLYKRIDLDQDPEAQQAIRRFLVQGFKNIREKHPLGRYIDSSWPSEETITVIAQKSSTQFIYAATVMKYVESEKHRPEERLHIILRISARPARDRPFAQLDLLYDFIFSNIEPEDRDVVWRILGILCIAGRGETPFNEVTPLLLEEILTLPTGQVYLLLDPLSSVIFCPVERQDRVIVLHASLFDYLLDQERSGALFLDVQYSYESLAVYCYWQSEGKVPGRFPDRKAGGSTDDGDFKRHPIMFFLVYAMLAHSSQDIRRCLSAIPHSALLRLKRLEQPVQRAFGSAQSEPAQHWLFVIISAVDRLTYVYAREDFADSRDIILDVLQGIFDHLKAELSEQGEYTVTPYGDPEVPRFGSEPSFLNQASKIYALIFNYMATWRSRVPMDPSEIIHIIYEVPLPRIVQHSLLFLLPNLQYRIEISSWILEISAFSDAERDRVLQLNIPEIDTPLYEECRIVVSGFLQSHARFVDENIIGELKSRWDCEESHSSQNISRFTAWSPPSIGVPQHGPKRVILP